MGKKRGKKENTDGNSGHYVIASSRPPECRPLERRPLVPIIIPNQVVSKSGPLLPLSFQRKTIDGVDITISMSAPGIFMNN